MAVTNVIPELWAREMVEVLKNNLVAAGICNTTIASALNMEGDKFHIPVAGTTTTAAYVEGTTTISYTSPTDTVKTLTIDQDQYAALNISDEEVKQANQDYAREYARDIAFNLAEDIDVQVMGQYTNAGLDSYETGTTPWQLGATGGDFPKLIASLHRQLDAAKARKEGRFLVLNAVGIEAARLYTAGRATSLGDDVTVNGAVGQFMGMTLIQSNNVVNASSVDHSLCGVMGRNIALATQISPADIEDLRLEGSYGTGVRARAKWGSVVYRPETLIDVNLNETLLA